MCDVRLPLVSLFVSVGLLMLVTLTIDYARAGWAVDGAVLGFSVVVIAVLTVIVQGYHLVVLHRLWTFASDQLDRAGGQPTVRSAGLAVGLLLVPGFNLYWVFRVFRGLTAALNAVAASKGVESRASELSATLTPVALVCVALLPVLLLVFVSATSAGLALLVGALVAMVVPGIYLNDAADIARAVAES